MEKILSLLRTKKFWALLAALVAAFSAFFVTGCTGITKIQRSGIHHDTVRYEQIVKHKDYVSCGSFQKSYLHRSSMPFASCIGFPRDRISLRSHASPCILTGFDFTSLTALTWPFVFRICAGSFLLTEFPISTIANSISLMSVSECLSSSPLMSCGSRFLMCLVPLCVVRKNRRGRPKSKPKTTKSIPLSGRHF